MQAQKKRRITLLAAHGGDRVGLDDHRFAKAIAAAKLAESASTCTADLRLELGCERRTLRRRHRKECQQRVQRRRRRVGQAHAEHDRCSDERQPAEKDAELCGASLGLDAKRRREHRAEGRKGIAHAAVGDTHARDALEIAERVNVGSPGTPPQERDQREPEAAHAARHHDCAPPPSASPNAAGPVSIAWVNPMRAITGAAKRSPIPIATAERVTAREDPVDTDREHHGAQPLRSRRDRRSQVVPRGTPPSLLAVLAAPSGELLALPGAAGDT